MGSKTRIEHWAVLLVACAFTASPGFADDDKSGRIEACETNIRIGGSVYHDRRPMHSWALLYPGASQRGGIYRPGMRVDAYRVVAIEPRGVLLERQAEVCWLRLAPKLESRARAPTPKPRAKRWRAPRTAFTRDELGRGVQRVQAQRYVVQRSLLREALARAPRIARSTKTRFIGGRTRPKGLMLRSLARGGLLEALGLKRNDVVKTLNGFSLTTPEGMLGARAQLQAAPRLSLSIERRGQPLTLEYRVE